MTTAPRDPWTDPDDDRSRPRASPLDLLWHDSDLPAPLPSEVTLGLWVLCSLTLTFGGWLLLVRFGAAPCSGPVCTVLTLGDQPVLTLVLAESCAATLGVLLPVRGGVSCAHGPRFAAIVVAVVAGAVALAGAAVLLLGVALCVLLLLAVVAAVAG